MIDTTTDAVLALADEWGYLLTVDAHRIIRAHGLEPEDAQEDLGDHITTAGRLLEWLGY